MHLYFIRHGQSHVNLPDWKHGNTDEGLTELGQAQAAALGKYLPTAIPVIDTLYASTMQRARETAEAVAGAYSNTIHFDDRLREVGNNKWDHTPWPNDALPKNYAGFWGTERPLSPLMDAEGAESWSHFRLRVSHFIEEMVVRHYYGVGVEGDGEAGGGEDVNIVVVCHGGVFEAAMGHIFNLGLYQRCEIWTHNTGITHYTYIDHPKREKWRLRYHNHTAHLAGIPNYEERMAVE